MEIPLTEHSEVDLLTALGVNLERFRELDLIKPRQFPSKRETRNCYSISEKQNSCFLKADYYIGVDWLIKGERFIQVRPKLNTKILQHFVNEVEKEVDAPEENAVEVEQPVFAEDAFKELDFLKMLLDTFQHPDIAKCTNHLLIIDWQAPQISIHQKDDALTPFLVVQFLNLLKQIVRRGLKKSYYKVEANLNNRIKGKVLVGTHIKQNVLKNRLTKTYCEYQEFGIDNQENRFLKKVLRFCSNYIGQNAPFFGDRRSDLEQLVNYCQPAFEGLSDALTTESLKHIKHNPFFKEYKQAIKIGQHILKRFAYNISNTSPSERIETPPFWIDMSKLFELYVYHHLLKHFSQSEIKYQFATYGNALDFLITAKGHEMVVDAKYKMHYRTSHIHQDIRQVAGYARLDKVYRELGKEDSEMIKCLIVYPCSEPFDDKMVNFALDENAQIKAYRDVYKIGIPMPYMSS